MTGNKTDSGYEQGSLIHDLPNLPPKMPQPGTSGNSMPKKNKRFPATTKIKLKPAIFDRKKKHCQSAMAAIQTNKSVKDKNNDTLVEEIDNKPVSEQSDTGSDDIYEDTAQEGSPNGVLHCGIAPVHSGSPVHSGNEGESQSEDEDDTDYETFDSMRTADLDQSEDVGIHPSDFMSENQLPPKSDDSSSNDSVYEDADTIDVPQGVHGRQNMIKNNQPNSFDNNNNSQNVQPSSMRKGPMPVQRRDKSLHSQSKEEAYLNGDNTLLYHALYNCEGSEHGDLSFKQGDIIYIVERETGNLWWKGRLRDQTGYVPSNYLAPVYES